VAETGGKSQLAGLVAAAIILLLAFGGSLLHHVPQAALGGVLLFVAMRIIRVGQIVAILPAIVRRIAADRRDRRRHHRAADRTGRRHRHHAVAAARHLEHHPRPRHLFERVPGTSIWWPSSSRRWPDSASWRRSARTMCSAASTRR
jgi:SulP family sulfate permease